MTDPGLQKGADSLAGSLHALEHQLEERSGVGSASSEGRDKVGQLTQEQDRLERLSNVSISGSSNDGSVNSLHIRKRRAAEARLHSESQTQPESTEREISAPAKSEGDRRLRRLGSGGVGSGAGIAHRGSGSGVGSEGRGSGVGVGNGAASGGRGSGVGVGSGVGAGGRGSGVGSTGKNSGAGSGNRGSGTGVGSGAGSGARGSGAGVASGTGVGSASIQSKSGSGSTKSEETFSSMSSAQQEHLKEVVASLEMTHSEEVRQIQDRRDDQDTRTEQRVVALVAQLSKLHSGEKVQARLQDLLNESRQSGDASNEQIDDLKEQVERLLLQQGSQATKHMKALSEQLTSSDEKAADLRGENDHDFHSLKSELAVASAHLARNAVNEKNLEGLLESSHSTAANVSDQHATSMASLQSLLDTATREIARRDKSYAAKTAKRGSGVEVADEFAAVHHLEDLLTASRTSQHQAQQELATSRLELLGATQKHSDEVGGLQMRLQSHEDSAAAVRGGRGGTIGVMKKRGPGKGMPINKLMAIEEEFDADDLGDQESSKLSGQVSSDGEEVGDLEDFEEEDPQKAVMRANETLNMATIKKLTEELTEAGIFEKMQAVSSEAITEELHSKIARLVAQLKHIRSEHFASSDAMDALRIEAADEQAAGKASNTQALLMEVQKREAMELTHKDAIATQAHQIAMQKMHVSQDADELYERLSFAMEAKRLESARLEDTKRELEAMEVRHALVVSDLNQRLLRHGESTTGAEPSESEQENLSIQVRQLRQDLNIRNNDYEILRVDMQSKLEQEQWQHVATAKAERQAKEDLANERQCTDKLKMIIAQKDEQLQKALQQHTSATDQKIVEKQRIEEVDKRQSSEAAAGSFWARFQCPVRKSEKCSQSTSCQAALWQLAGALRGVIAMQCNVTELSIVDASKKACEIFGSASLGDGCTILSLLSDVRSGARLRQELGMRKMSAKVGGVVGFWLKELGCMEFRSKHGTCFDSLVIAAYLPAEPDHEHEASLFVFVEPLVEASELMPPMRTSHVDIGEGRRRRPIGMHHSNSMNDGMSVGSSEIGPGDSISNCL